MLFIFLITPNSDNGKIKQSSFLSIGWALAQNSNHRGTDLKTNLFSFLRFNFSPYYFFLYLLPKIASKVCVFKGELVNDDVSEGMIHEYRRW